MLTNLKEIKDLISPILFAIENCETMFNVEYTYTYSEEQRLNRVVIQKNKNILYTISINYYIDNTETVSIWYKGCLVEKEIQINSDYSDCVHNYLIEAINNLETKLKGFWKSQQKSYSNL